MICFKFNWKGFWIKECKYKTKEDGSLLNTKYFIDANYEEIKKQKRKLLQEKCGDQHYSGDKIINNADLSDSF